MSSAYPSSAAERTRWISERRGGRSPVQADRPYAFFSERERGRAGDVQDVATVFLTNRECPWRCVMCDLWRNTTERPVTGEQIVQQIRFALSELPLAAVLKIYNSGSFFDSGAIPVNAWEEIAAICRGFRHLIVECHPNLVGPRVLRLAEMLSCSFEVALGLETAHPAALEALNKRTTLDDYRRAAALLKGSGIQLRTFLLVHPPFVAGEERQSWLSRSIETAFDCGSDVVSLIPLRSGNGAVDDLMRSGEAKSPSITELEEAQELGIRLERGRCFADSWDLGVFSQCAECLDDRSARIQRMNLSQTVEKRVRCARCGNG